MKNSPTVQGLMVACLATCLLLSASDRVPAQTMKTKNTSGLKSIPQQCVLAVLPKGDSPGQWAKMITVGTVRWVMPLNANQPEVTYEVKLGLDNSGGSQAWTSQVQFVLTDVRQDWYPAETVQAPMTGPASSPHAPWQTPKQVVSLPLPPGGLPAGQSVMATTTVKQVVQWRHRPSLMVTAIDKDKRLLGSCLIEDMNVASREIGPARDIDALRNQPSPMVEDPQTPPRPKSGPNWGELKSPQ